MATVDPQTGQMVMAGAIVIAGMVGYVVGIFTNHVCLCGKCAFHVNERRMDNERKRASRHVDVHREYRIPWGDERCAQCKLGHEDDKP